MTIETARLYDLANDLYEQVQEAKREASQAAACGTPAEAAQALARLEVVTEAERKALQEADEAAARDRASEAVVTRQAVVNDSNAVVTTFKTWNGWRAEICKMDMFGSVAVVLGRGRSAEEAIIDWRRRAEDEGHKVVFA